MLVTRAVLATLCVVGSIGTGVLFMRFPQWSRMRTGRAIVGLSFCTALLTLNSAAVNGLRWAFPSWVRVIELVIIVTVVAALNVSFYRERREIARRQSAIRSHRKE